MRELVAHCVIYLRDNPQDREIIELIIDRILEERGEVTTMASRPRKRSPQRC
jgi:hypothetical protein